MIWRAVSINKQIYDKPLDISESMKKTSKVNIELYLPPSDIPQYIHPDYNKKDDIFIINFKYFDTEKEKELFNKENIKFFIGLNSGKPLRIEISNIDTERIGQVKLTNIIRNDISRLIEENITPTSAIREKSNLRITEEILKENAAVLAEEAA